MLPIQTDTDWSGIIINDFECCSTYGDDLTIYIFLSNQVPILLLLEPYIHIIVATSIIMQIFFCDQI